MSFLIPQIWGIHNFGPSIFKCSINLVLQIMKYTNLVLPSTSLPDLGHTSQLIINQVSKIGWTLNVMTKLLNI